MTHMSPDSGSLDEMARQLQELKDDEVVAFIRDTVIRLDILADRLERLVEGEDENAKPDLT